MTTDPRIAALTKALRKTLPRRGDLVSSTDWENAAAAILAELPPDWCGHIGVEEAIAQGQRRLASSERAADAHITMLRAELARLRKIEKAARALANRTDNLTVHFTGGMPYLVVKPDWFDALRATLEADHA